MVVWGRGVGLREIDAPRLKALVKLGRRELHVAVAVEALEELIYLYIDMCAEC